MKSLFVAALLGTTVFATPAHAQNVRAIMGSLLATATEPAQLNAKCDTYINAIKARKDRLEHATSKPTLANTMRPYDRMGALMSGAGGEYSLYQEVLGTKALRDAANACLVRLDTVNSQINLSRPIYERLKAMDISGADAETRRYVTRTLADLERTGVSLDKAKRARIQQINDKLSKLSTEFSTNIAESVGKLKVKPAELAGLPQDFIDAHKPGADGMITLTTATTDYFPVMTYADSDDLRRRFSEIYDRRAYPQNDPVLKQIFTLREEKAHLLGRPNYAALVLENKMVNTPAKVEHLFKETAAIARPIAERDYALQLKVLQDVEPGATRIEPWQSAWVANMAKKKYFDFDAQATRKYFPYKQARDGIFKLAEDLFGVQIRPWNTPLWDKNAEAWEMLQNGKVIGRFYFDNHPRDGKYTHANQIPIFPGNLHGGVPVSALVMNVPGGDGTAGLMSIGQVRTMLHEFGHLLHFIFSGRQEWYGVGQGALEWDAIEAPSQMLENWVYDYPTLAKFAVDADGQTIPRALVEKMDRARYFNRGMMEMGQLGLANISLQFHMQQVPANLGAATRKWYDEYGMIPMQKTDQMQDAFGHLDGYSAIYYTYLWSRVVAANLFSRFKHDGLRNAKTAAAYRRDFLSRGGTEPAATMVAAFTGHPISYAPFKAELEKDKVPAGALAPSKPEQK